MMKLTDEQKQRLIKIRNNFRKWPEKYFTRVLGVTTLLSNVIKILRAIVAHDRVCIRATHSISKTWTLGRVILWFLSVYKPSIVITTAPTFRQVNKLLWGELRDAHKNAVWPIGGHLTGTELKFNDKWYAMGFSTKKDAQSSSKEQSGSNFSGFHSKYVLIVFDEATGVPADIYTMAEGLMTSGLIVKWVCIANPTTRNCKFFSLFHDPAWHKVHLSCFESPNMIANGFTSKAKVERELEVLRKLKPGPRLKRIEGYKLPVTYLLKAQWAIPFVLKHGMKHPLVQGKVWGEFPDDDDYSMVPYSTVEAAIERDIEVDINATRYVGVDVARFGDDDSRIVEVLGYKETDGLTITKRDVTHVAGQVIAFLKADNYSRPTVLSVDCVGIGAGVYDILVEAQTGPKPKLGKHIIIIEIQSGASPEDEGDKETYLNVRAQMFGKLGEDIKHNLDIMNDDEHTSQLPNIIYKFTSTGKIQVEPKDKFKARTAGRSPDRADALAMCNIGRHLDVEPGRFIPKKKTKPLTKRTEKRDTFKRINSRIKVRES